MRSAATSDRVSLATNGAARLVVTADGNIGVGTNSPKGRLDVRGDIFSNGYRVLPIVGIALDFNNVTSNAAWINGVSEGERTNNVVQIETYAYTAKYGWGASHIRFYLA